MRITKNIRVEQVTHPKRLPLNIKVLMLALKIWRGEVIPPPIHVKIDGGGFVLLDGRHRLAAYKLAGKALIPATYGIVEDPRVDKPLPHRKA